MRDLDNRNDRARVRDLIQSCQDKAKLAFVNEMTAALLRRPEVMEIPFAASAVAEATKSSFDDVAEYFEEIRELAKRRTSPEDKTLPLTGKRVRRAFMMED